MCACTNDRHGGRVLVLIQTARWAERTRAKTKIAKPSSIPCDLYKRLDRCGCPYQRHGTWQGKNKKSAEFERRFGARVCSSAIETSQPYSKILTWEDAVLDVGPLFVHAENSARIDGQEGRRHQVVDRLRAEAEPARAQAPRVGGPNVSSNRRKSPPRTRLAKGVFRVSNRHQVSFVGG